MRRREMLKKIKLLEMCALILFAFSIALLIPSVRALAPTATVISCNIGGELTEEFGPGEIVYACGEGYEPFESVTIYVVPNNYPNHEDFSKCSADAVTDEYGILGPTALCVAGSELPVGEYDIWVDRDGNGWRSYAFEPVWYFCSRGGFFVIPEFWLGTILGLLGCFAAFGVFRMSKSKYLRK